MTVNTGKVSGRRSLHFESLAEVLDDATRLATGPVWPLGNWSLGQVLMHLARTMDQSIDGSDAVAPLWMRAVMRVVGPLAKKRSLTKGVPAGFKLPQPWAGELIAGPEVTTDDGLEAIRKAIERLGREPPTARHPAFGKMTSDQWRQLHCRHSELHLSFIVPYQE